MTAAEQFMVREHRQGDEDALKRIIELSFENGIYSFFANRSLKTAPKIFVVEREGTVIGFAEPRYVRIKKEKVGNILWLATHPDFRRSGVASNLVDECIRYLKETATGRVYVSIERDNQSSLGLFEKKGFTRIEFSELAKRYGFRVLSFYSRFMIAPHEKVMVLNF
jgi:ribosomal protein S18 acetylase RimI-like enzyme